MNWKLTATLVFTLVFTLSLAASQTTVTGILTDDMCTRKHMMPGKPNAECVRECIKHGAKYVVVSRGKIFELEGKDTDFGEFAGKKVTVTGQLKGKALSVTSISTAQ